MSSFHYRAFTPYGHAFIVGRGINYRHFCSSPRFIAIAHSYDLQELYSLLGVIVLVVVSITGRLAEVHTRPLLVQGIKGNMWTLVKSLMFPVIDNRRIILIWKMDYLRWTQSARTEQKLFTWAFVMQNSLFGDFLISNNNNNSNRHLKWPSIACLFPFHFLNNVGCGFR